MSDDDSKQSAQNDSDFSRRQVASDEVDRSDPNQVNSIVMHGLLTEWFEGKSIAERRIQQTLEAFEQLRLAEAQTRLSLKDNAEVDLSSEVDETSFKPIVDSGNAEPRRTRGRRLPRQVKWLAFIAASILLCLFPLAIWNASQPSELQASMDRVVESALSNDTRVYQVDIERPAIRRQVIGSCTLYSKSTDRFMVVFDTSRIQPTAIGGNGEGRWLIRGRRSWSSDSSLEMPRDFVIDKLTMAHMQINSLLTSLPDQFELRILEPETLPGSLDTECRPILARRKKYQVGLPAEVKIWPHPKTGVVHRMWIRQGLILPQRKAGSIIDLRLDGTESLSDEFFSLEYQLDQFGI